MKCDKQVSSPPYFWWCEWTRSDWTPSWWRPSEHPPHHSASRHTASCGQSRAPCWTPADTQTSGYSSWDVPIFCSEFQSRPSYLAEFGKDCFLAWCIIRDKTNTLAVIIQRRKVRTLHKNRDVIRMESGTHSLRIRSRSNLTPSLWQNALGHRSESKFQNDAKWR